MRDVIEKLREIEKKFGHIAFAEHFKASAGYYFRVNKDESIESFYYSGAKDDPFLLKEEYQWFKDRLFFEGMLNANKAIDAKLKKIHSVTPNAMIFKYGIFEDDKLKAKGFTFKDVIYNHLDLINKMNDNQLDIEKLSNTFIKVFEYVQEELKETCKKDDKLLIFLDEDIDSYKKYYEKYLEEKIFLTEDTVLVVDGVKYGVPSFSISLNSKKPTLSKNPYNKVPFRVTLDEAILLNYLTKININKVNDLLSEDDTSNSVDLYLEMNSNSKVKEIVGYDMNVDEEDYQCESCKMTILESEYANINPIIGSLNRQELLDEIEWNFSLEKGSYLFHKLLNIRNGDYKDFTLKCKTNDISSIFISNKEVLKFYFNEHGDILIDKELSKIMYLLYLELIKKDNSIKRLRVVLDFMLSALDYVNKDGGYNKMPEKIKNIWDKLVEAKKSGTLIIESDEEFFFVGGQLLYWLSTLNETANTTSVLLQDVLDLRSSIDIKNKAIDKYKQYVYKIPSHSMAFINTLHNAVISYEIDKEIKMKDFKYKYYYHSGLIGKNIKFESVKKEEVMEDLLNE